MSDIYVLWNYARAYYDDIVLIFMLENYILYLIEAE